MPSKLTIVPAFTDVSNQATLISHCCRALIGKCGGVRDTSGVCLQPLNSHMADMAVLEEMHKSLLVWVKRHRHCLQYFYSHNSRDFIRIQPCKQAVSLANSQSALQLVSRPGHQLQVVMLVEPSVLDMKSLSAFTGLRSYWLSYQQPVSPDSVQKLLHKLLRLQEFNFPWKLVIVASEAPDQLLHQVC